MFAPRDRDREHRAVYSNIPTTKQNMRRPEQTRTSPRELTRASFFGYFTRIISLTKSAGSSSTDQASSDPSRSARFTSQSVSPFNESSSSPLLPTEPVSNFHNQDAETPTPQNGLSARWKAYPSWRRTLWCAMVGVGFVFLVNLGSMITVAVVYGWGSDGLPAIRKGSCKETKALSRWLHFLINILGAGLLGASNYAMQVVSAPSRNDIDRLHRQRQWVSIGVSSMRNVRPRRIGWGRVSLWWLLCLSSLPIHFVYNSVIYSVVSTNAYNAFLLSESTLQSTPDIEELKQENRLITANGYSTNNPEVFKSKYDFTNFFENIRGYSKMDREQCVRAYGTDYVTDFHDLVLVTSNASFAYIAEFGLEYPSYGWSKYPYYVDWMFREDNGDVLYSKWKDGFSADAVLSREGPLTIFGQILDYCLVEKAEAICALHYHLPIMLVMVICSVVKIGCIWATIYHIKQRPLVNLGDAVASFLEVPDPNTQGMCLLTRGDFDQVKKTDVGREKESVWVPKASPRAFKYQQYKWRESSSPTTWGSCMVISILALSITGALLAMSLEGIQNYATLDFMSLWKQGFGAVHSYAIISDYELSDAANVLMANSPQALFSFIYLFYNSLFTKMLQGAEWASYANVAKGLRVSEPEIGSEQWSRYYLHLPFKYGVPLMAYSSLMHWMVSQTLFYVKVVPLIHGKELPNPPTNSGVGFSPIAIIFVLIGGGLLMLVTIAIGFRKYPKGMPLARSCSAVIAAASHHKDGYFVARKKVIWGEVWQWETLKEWHCTFAEDAKPPIEGRLYS